MKMTIDKFISRLTIFDDSDILTNQYKNPIKAKNLAVYLTYMKNNPPVYLFVGEAPGYGGCALTGIPFTDEFRLISSGKTECFPLLSSDYGIVSEVPHKKEESATIIWDVFSRTSFFPLLWNIVPFHPHESNNSESNRTPEISEIEAHCWFVKDLLELFPSINQENGIYAVGRKPQRGLENMRLLKTNDDSKYIRHPANGGEKKCREKIIEIAKSAKKSEL